MMLKITKEKDFFLIKKVILGRLSPEGISRFLTISLIPSVTVDIVPIYATLIENLTNSKYIVSVAWVSAALLILQLVVTLLYRNRDLANKYQKSQSLWLLVIALKLLFDIYQLYFFMCIVRVAPQYMIYTGFMIMFGGLAFSVLMFRRAVGRVKGGKLRKGGIGLYTFNNSKSYVSIRNSLFAGAIIGGVLSCLNAINNVYGNVDLYFVLFVSILTHFIIATIFPEFVFLAYCKRRFKSFNRNMPRVRSK